MLMKFVNEFIVSNPFVVCSDELSFIKKQLQREGDEVKVKQKAGVIQYKAYQERYASTLRLIKVHLGVKRVFNFKNKRIHVLLSGLTTRK